MSVKSTDYDMKVRTGHTRPIDFTLERDGAAVDVSGSSARVVRGRIKGKATTKFQGSLTFATDGSDGKVRYTPGSTDFNTAGVIYDPEIKITMSDGVEFVPDVFRVYAEEAFSAVPS